MPVKSGKRQFIDRGSAAHFHLVHRSQRDPRAADPEAPQRVLAPTEVGQRKGTSQQGSQSSSAWLAEQDLGGFDEANAGPEATPAESNSDLGLPEDGYQYAKHLKTMGGGTFVDKDGTIAGSVAGSVARSRASGVSRASNLSRAYSLQLRGVPEDAFESVEELPVGVGGAHNECAQRDANPQPSDLESGGI